MRSPDTSLSSTSKPASAATWAMPLPIWPAPITPIFLMVSAMIVVRLAPVRLTLAVLAEFGGKLGQRLIEIGDKAIVGDLEDRRLLVLVDRDDHLGILHAGEMLDGARDADRDIEFRRHHLAGLADLPVVGRIAGIDRCARGPNRGAELVGNRF